MDQLSSVKYEVKGLPHIEIIEKIGQGSFGDIYKVWDSKKEKWTAIKFEKIEKKSKYSLLRKEAQIMEEISEFRYFPSLFDCRFQDQQGIISSQQQQQYNFIEMSFLGPNLESLKKRMGGKLSLRTVLLIANQMISGMEALHSKGIIHRDIKPENFVIGSEGQHHYIFVIDFGLSKYYIEDGGKHIEQKQNKGLVGTARYTSVNSHLGLEQSRRDDLESIGYLLIYFAKGSLVWQNLQVKDKEERFQKISELKQTTSTESLCKGMPKAFHDFLALVKDLRFEEAPDYSHYRQLFTSCYKQHFTTPETYSCYDWCPKNCPLIFKAIQLSSQQKNVQFYSSQIIPQAPKSKRTNQNDSLINDTPKNANNQSKDTFKPLNLKNSQEIITPQNQQAKLAQSTIPGIQLGMKSDTKIGTSQMAVSVGDQLNSKAINQNNNLALSVFNKKMMINSEQTDQVNQSQIIHQQIDESFQNFKIIPNKSAGRNAQSASKNNSKELLAMLDRHAVVSPINKQNKSTNNNYSYQNINNNNNDHHIDREDNLSESSPLSELLPGDRNKSIPVFFVQNNIHSNRKLETKNKNFSTQLSKNFFQNNDTQIFSSSSNLQINTKNPKCVAMKSYDDKQECEVSIIQQQFGLTSGTASHNQNGFQMLSIGNVVLNKDNSQFVNNQSNEWNSLQDEKVDIQQILPFHSSQSSPQQQ